MGVISQLKAVLSRKLKPLDGPVEFNQQEIRVLPPTEQRMRWEKIHRIVTYKIDLLTYDEIRVQLEGSDGSVIVVTEESPGFASFMAELVHRYPSASDWHAKVSQPAFAENWTVLYESNELRT